MRRGSRHDVAVASRCTRIASDRGGTAGITGIATAITAATGTNPTVATFHGTEKAIEELRNIGLGFLGSAKDRTITAGIAARIKACGIAANRGTALDRGTALHRSTAFDLWTARLARSTGNDGVTGTTGIQRTRSGFQKILQTGKQVALLLAASIARITGIDIIATAIIRLSDSAQDEAQCKRNNQKLGLHRQTLLFPHSPSPTKKQ